MWCREFSPRKLKKVTGGSQNSSMSCRASDEYFHRATGENYCRKTYIDSNYDSKDWIYFLHRRIFLRLSYCNELEKLRIYTHSFIRPGGLVFGSSTENKY